MKITCSNKNFLSQCLGHSSEVTQLCPTLWDPMDCSLPGSSIHGIFQARILEWVAISFSRRSSPPRDWTWGSRIVGRRFTVWATREVLGHSKCSINTCSVPFFLCPIPRRLHFSNKIKSKVTFFSFLVTADSNLYHFPSWLFFTFYSIQTVLYLFITYTNFLSYFICKISLIPR